MLNRPPGAADHVPFSAICARSDNSQLLSVLRHNRYHGTTDGDELASLKNFNWWDRTGAAKRRRSCPLAGMSFCLLLKVPSETTALKKPNLEDSRDTTWDL